MWFLTARQRHGIRTLTEQELTSMCVHQNHDDISAVHRDADAAIASLRGVPHTADELWR
jgi:hypothetical protein